MKGYQNIDLIEQIELLETEVVRLREERERDQIIMRQLRNDNMMFSSKGSLSSPRSMAKFAPTLSPRYDYWLDLNYGNFDYPRCKYHLNQLIIDLYGKQYKS